MNDKIEQVRERMRAVAARLGELAELETLTDDQRAEFDALTTESKALAERHDRMVEAARAGRLVAEPPPGGPPAQTDAQRAAAVKRRAVVVPGRTPPGFDDARQAYRSGMWFLAECLGDRRAARWCMDHGVRLESRALGGAVNTAGGYLVPPEFERAIINLRENYGTFRRKARRVPMSGDTISVPRRTSGVTAYFVGENSEITASDMAWNQVTLTARKLAVLTKWSSEINEDSLVEMAGLLADEIAYAFAVKEDACGFNGDGTSTYGGIVGLITACAAATATIVTAASGKTAFSTLDLTDFEAMLGKLPEYPGIRQEWYISKAGWAASMMRLADAAGGATVEELTSGQRQRTFLGYPVNFVQCMNSTLTAQASTKGLVYFGDLSLAATFGDRRGIRLKISDQRYFEYDQLAIQGTERFDIVVHDVGDTSNAGAIVMLATPAS